MFGLSHLQLSHTATAMGGAVPFQGGGVGELREGTMGSAVKELQSKLNVLQYGPVAVDGTFGASTKQALMNFQATEGIGGTPPSGVLDAETEARLNQRILNVSTGAGAGVNPQTGLPVQPTPARPWWQTALMVAGGVAIAGGVIYLLTSDDSKGGYKRALSSRTVEHDPNVATRFKREVKAHGSTLRGAHRAKCDRAPSESAFDEGEALSAPEVTS
ncbi:MAG: hypothetical protein EPN91_08605 [Salinibacterium sp.]|nr:MAG: hypothetical protein EPN91_08605 [Salinibacterium sp.]